MPFTISDYLTPVQAVFPSGLIGEQALTDIHQVTRMMPGPLTAAFGFECRLGTDDAQVDFALCARRHEPGRRILAGNDRQWTMPEALLTEQAWHRVHSFCRDWDDPESPLYELVDKIWLEFDLVEGAPATPVPSIFFGTHKTIYGANPTDENRWVTGRALPLLMENTLSEETGRMLLSCFAALPDQANVFQIGVMLARQVDAVRVCIRDIPPDAIPTYLDRIGWPGETSDIRNLMTEVTDKVDQIALDIDVGYGVYPKIGLECRLNKQPQAEPRWATFLDYLVARNLCTEAKRTDLLRYSGSTHERQAEAQWPDHLRTASSFMGSNTLSLLVRRINHIKVVYQPEAPLEAKAYVGVEHHWVDLKAYTTKMKSIATVASTRLSSEHPGTDIQIRRVTGSLKVNREVLTPLVRSTCGDDTLKIRNWSFSLVHGGPGKNARVYRFTGEAGNRSSSHSWTLILKEIRRADLSNHRSALRYWKREPLVYASGLLAGLPGELAAPRLLNMVELKDEKIWLWLEDVADDSVSAWSPDRFILAARHLGYFNGIHPGALYEDSYPWLCRHRLVEWLDDMAKDLETLAIHRSHPMIREIYTDDMLNDLTQVWIERGRFLTALTRLPHTLCHGDARYTAQSNLFSRRRPFEKEQTVAIDWAYTGIDPIGTEPATFIGAPLVFGDLSAEEAQTLSPPVLEAYISGLEAAGLPVSSDQVTFGYAATIALKFGLRGLQAVIQSTQRSGDTNLEDRVNQWRRIQPFLHEQCRKALYDLNTLRSQQ